MLCSRVVVRLRSCLLKQAVRDYAIITKISPYKFSKGLVKSLCFVSGGLYISQLYSRRTLLCIAEEPVVLPNELINTNQLDTHQSNHSNTFLQNAATVLRLSCLIVLFAPAVVLHLFSYIIDSATVRDFKWLYVRFALQKAGPAFVKLGQWISTRRDLFHPDVCEILCHLQKNCYTHSWAHTERILEYELGPHWKDYFDETDQTPIGSGCVAQVYKWNLSDKGVTEAAGHVQVDRERESSNNRKMRVAVKVLHPNIRTSISRDLSIIKFVANFMDRVYPDFYWISLKECVDDFSSVMEKQVDMELEARNTEKFKSNFCNHPGIVFPTVIHPFIKQSILVESFEDGTHIGEFIDGCNPDSHKSLAVVGIDTLLSMLFVHNFVHCDLHPGNILVRLPADPSDMPTLVILDCGVATSLSKRDWSIFFDLFSSIVKGESQKVADLMLDNAQFSNCQNVEDYRNEMDRLITDAVQQLNLQSVDVSSLLSRLFEVLIKNTIKLESNFTSVMLAVMVIEGLGRSLDPEMDILEAARPFLLNTVKRQIMMHFD